MKISKSKLEQIIREELSNYLAVDEGKPGYVAGQYMGLGGAYKRDDLEVDPEVDPYERAMESPVEEVLGPDDDIGDYIEDFSDSNAPSLKGKSKKKRKEMAIAAHYGAKEKS